MLGDLPSLNSKGATEVHANDTGLLSIRSDVIGSKVAALTTDGGVGSATTKSSAAKPKRISFQTSSKKSQSVDDQLRAIADQERLVATLQEQKILRDAQMLKIREAFTVLGEVVKDAERIEKEGEGANDVPEVVDVEKHGDKVAEEVVLPAAAEGDEGAVGKAALASSAVEDLMTALNSFVSTRERDRVEREAIGFFGSTQQTDTAVKATDDGDAAMAADRQLLAEEEAALLELLVHRQQRRGAKRAKKPSKRQKANNNSANLASEDTKEPPTNEYEDDFESEDESIADKTRADVIAKLLAEYAQEKEAAGGDHPAKVVGLSWLEEEEEED